LRIEVSGVELHDAILRSGMEVQLSTRDERDWPAFLPIFFSIPSIIFNLHRSHGNAFYSEQIPSYGISFPRAGGAVPTFANIVGTNGEVTIRDVGSGTGDTLPNLIYWLWQNDVFFFKAERYSLGRSQHIHATRLNTDASNLPAILDTLSATRGDLFNELVDHLREIFPTVGNLSVRPHPQHQNQNEILVWPTEKMGRAELSFPLDSSGTGVAQAVAILAAIMTFDKAIIIIDEISSFLHPAAAKALLRIIQTRYGHHQYIISTHSPEVIGFSNPRTLQLVRRNGYASTVEELPLDRVEMLREVADHLGVSMSDVFAADRIIWVEGVTEELCFPYLYQELVGALPRGLAFLSVVAPGDFLTKRRTRELVYEVYSRLSSASSALTVSVAFSFDSEKLSNSEKEEMTKESKGRVQFLPRRHLECYLIDPEAISVFITARDGAASGHITPEAAAAALRSKALEPRFKINIDWDGQNLGDENWLAQVDAARLINDVCQTLSEGRGTFSKTEDSLELVKFLVADRPAALDGLARYIESLVSKSSTGR